MGWLTGLRTRNLWSHNPVLCQLSYSHHLPNQHRTSGGLSAESECTRSSTKTRRRPSEGQPFATSAHVVPCGRVRSPVARHQARPELEPACGWSSSVAEGRLARASERRTPVALQWLRRSVAVGSRLRAEIDRDGQCQQEHQHDVGRDRGQSPAARSLSQPGHHCSVRQEDADVGNAPPVRQPCREHHRREAEDDHHHERQQAEDPADGALDGDLSRQDFRARRPLPSAPRSTRPGTR